MEQDVILSMVGREEECTGKKIDTEIKKVRGKTRGESCETRRKRRKGVIVKRKRLRGEREDSNIAG